MSEVEKGKRCVNQTKYKTQKIEELSCFFYSGLYLTSFQMENVKTKWLKFNRFIGTSKFHFYVVITSSLFLRK